MIITGIKIENFVGFKKGINKDIIELKDLPSGIIPISGQNGSGKTTLIQSLSIFSDNKDFLIPDPISNNEKQLFIPATKVITVTNGKNKYIITHQYSKTGSKKSFINKNGKELNGNGNVSTFEEILSLEFKIENRLTDNSVIGVQTNFIDLPSTKRKSEISSILPDIDRYIKLYKRVSNEINSIKKIIEHINKSLIGINNLDEFETKLLELKEEKKVVSFEYKEKESEINNYIQKMSESNNITKNLQLEIEELEKKNRRLNKLTTKIEESDIKEISKEEMQKAKVKIKKIEEQNNSIMIDIEKLNDELQVLSEKINKSKTAEEKIKELESKIDKYKAKLDFSVNELNTKNSNKAKNSKNLEEIQKKFSFLFENNNYLLNKWIPIYEKFREKIISRINKTDTEVIVDILDNNRYEQERENLERITMELSNIENTKNVLKSLTSLKNVSDIKRNKKCNISECLESIELQVEDNNNKKSVLEKKLNNTRDFLEEYKDINDLINRFKLSDDFKVLNKILNQEKKDKNWILKPINTSKISNKHIEISSIIEFILKLNSSTIKEISDITELEADIKSIKEVLNTLKAELKEIESKSEENLSINKLLSKFNKIKDTIEAKKNEITNNKKEISKENIIIEEYLHFMEQNETKSEIKLLKKDLSILPEKQKLLFDREVITKDFENKIEEAKEEKSEIQEKHHGIVSEISKLEVQSDNIQELISEKEKLENKLDYYRLLNEALHPTKGVPKIIIETHLKQIEDIANEIFNKTFDGRFLIKLKNTEDEFLIVVHEQLSDSLIPDILKASEGQKSIIKLVLSIAILKFKIKSKNICLRLDEIDSLLDEENRDSFERLLTDLKDSLGIEQIFIITHNDIINNAPVSIKLDRKKKSIKRIEKKK